MKWTGERLETFVFNYNTLEHLHRYAITTDFVKNKRVADIACGEGYGSYLISKHAEHVIGVDIDEEIITKAKTKYNSPNIEFRIGDATKVPIQSNSIDVIVSFETIEHVFQHEVMLQEIKRILKDDGVLIMSSPDKKYYSDIPNYRNNFHLKELYIDEFKQLMQQYFQYCCYYYQRVIKGSFIINEKMNDKYSFNYYSGNYSLIEKKEFNPLYNICIASNTNVPALPVSVFESAPIEQLINEVLQKSYEAKYNKKLDQITRSWSYRIGRLFTFPVRMFK